MNVGGAGSDSRGPGPLTAVGLVHAHLALAYNSKPHTLKSPSMCSHFNADVLCVHRQCAAVNRIIIIFFGGGGGEGWYYCHGNMGAGTSRETSRPDAALCARLLPRLP